MPPAIVPDPLPDLTSLAPVLAGAGVGLCVASAEGLVERANEPWLRLAGVADAGAAHGRHLADLFPGSAALLRDAVAAAAAGQLVSIPPQRRFAEPHDVWWEATLAPAGRAGAGVVVVARDVSARLEAEVASDRVATLQRFTEALSSAVRMKDVARVLFERGLEQLGAKAIGIVWMMHPGKLELVFGHGLSEREFRQLDAAAHAGERMPIRDAILEKRSVWLETPEEIRHRYPVLEPLRALRGESGFAVVPLFVGDRCPGVIGFTFDRPRRFSQGARSFVEALAKLSAQAFERARLFEAEQEARREAERTRDLQHRLMAMVGHDLRTPLGAIQLSAGALSRRGNLDPGQAKFVERIATSAERMNAIIRDLLDFGRARQGLGVALRLERVDLGELARRAVAELEGTGHDRVSLGVHGDPILQGDAARLSQVLSNLVGNALQHGASGEVHVEVDGRGPDVLLSVHNGGPAIPPELLPHVFEAFRHGEDERSPGGSGSTGLGLFIVREIVAAHRATVVVSSDAASGTTFTVRLPRDAGEG